MSNGTTWNNVKVKSAGKYRLRFRYANGSGGVALMDRNLTCNSSVTYQVENVIFATCDTLKDTCWKKKMGSSSKNILGYTNLSYDGIAKQNAKKLANNINSGMSYVRAWCASNTSLNALRDRWCAYVREGNRIVEYSARSGNKPRYPEKLEPVHGDEIVFVEPCLLEDTRDFDASFRRLNTASYMLDSGVEPRATFYDTDSAFLQKSSGLEPDHAEQRAEELVSIVRNSIAIVDVEPCYGSSETGAIVPAHCFTDTLGTTWVVDALSGDLVE